MKKNLIITIGFLLASIFCHANAVFAQTQSATSTMSATSTISISSTITGFPEWNQDETRQMYIWRQNANLIRSGVSQLPAIAEPNLPIPILFGISPANLTANFGDARGSSRSHEGLDIMAPKGTLVVSPTPAVVLSVGTGPDSGNYVTMANPGGETFVYMHLDRAAKINAGDILAAGSLIGYVGNTGNAAGCAAHLHFEIRKNGATNPLPRLTREFSLTEKMTSLKNIILASDDKSGLAKLLVGLYPGQFSSALGQGIALPQEIAAEIARVSATGNSLVSSGLAVGAQGSNVIALQNFLILQNKGPAAAKLGYAGATGYFGLITRNALDEYKTFAGIQTPAKLTVAQIKAKIAQIQTLILSLQKQLLALNATAQISSKSLN